MRPWLGQAILEVGCGVGHLTGLLLEHGKVLATDVNEDYLQIVQNKFRDHTNLKKVFLWDIRRPAPKELDEVIDRLFAPMSWSISKRMKRPSCIFIKFSGREGESFCLSLH